MARQSTQAEIRQSIKELRQIYDNLSDEQFVKWYSKRYRVSAASIVEVLSKGGEIRGANRTI